VYPKVESNKANEGIGSDLGYAIIAGGKVTIEEGTTQSGGNQGNGNQGNGNQGNGNQGNSNPGNGNPGNGNPGNSNPGGGGASLNLAPVPQASGLKQHLWLAALSTPDHRFDFPWLAQTSPPPPAPNNAQNNGNPGNGNPGNGNQGNGNQGNGNQGKGNQGKGNQGNGNQGGGNNQNQQRVIAASIHAQDDIDLADVNVTGFATSGGTVKQARQVAVQVWDQSNCKDCFVDVENDFENFADRIKSYAETIKETYPDSFEEIQQGAFGSAQSNGNQDSSGSTGGGNQGRGNQNNGNQGGATGSGGANGGGTTGGGTTGGGTGAGAGGASLNLAPVPQASGLKQHLWLAALSTPDHRFDFPWLAQNTGTATGGSGATGNAPTNGGAAGNGNQGNGNQGKGNQGNGNQGGGNNQNQQAVEFQDLQGKIYYYDGDVTIYGNAAPVNGTIVATGDIIVEPFATGSSSGIGSRLCPADQPLVGQTVATVQAILQFGQTAIPWATTAASLAATVSASAAGTAATAGTGAVVAAPVSAEQILQFALQTVKVLNQGRIAATELCGLARSAIGTARGLLPSNGANNASADSSGQSNSQNSNNNASTNSSGQSNSQNSNNNASTNSSRQSNSPEFAPLNLIAGGNIELHRDLLGTMIAKGDITIGSEVMQIAYPPLPEEAPRLASWQRNYYLLDKNQKP